MLPSRGMGAISRDKVPKKIMRRDADVPVKLYSCGGMAFKRSAKTAKK